MKTKNILAIVIVAILLYVIYKWYLTRAAVQSPGITTDSTTNPVTGQTTTAYTAANGTVAVPVAVTDWLKTLPPNNQAQAFKMLPTMTANDIAGLQDLILNLWAAGKQPTAAQTAFWNAWRTKYHINDGTVSNFVGSKQRARQYKKRMQ